MNAGEREEYQSGILSGQVVAMARYKNIGNVRAEILDLLSTD
jgi:hypothetical protein